MLLAHQLLRLEHMVLRVTRVREHKVLGFRMWGHKPPHFSLALPNWHPGEHCIVSLVPQVPRVPLWVEVALPTQCLAFANTSTKCSKRSSPSGRPKVGKTGTSNLQDLSADRTGWVQLPMCTHIVQCWRADWRITWQCINSWAMTQSFLREMECIAFWSQWLANPFDGKRKSLWWQHWQLCLSSHIGCTNSVFDLLCVSKQQLER